LAEAILGKIKVQIVEGKYFDKPREDAKTFSPSSSNGTCENMRANGRTIGGM
jgi:hypothetical protein